MDIFVMIGWTSRGNVKMKSSYPNTILNYKYFNVFTRELQNCIILHNDLITYGYAILHSHMMVK